MSNTPTTHDKSHSRPVTTILSTLGIVLLNLAITVTITSMGWALLQGKAPFGLLLKIWFVKALLGIALFSFVANLLTYALALKRTKLTVPTHLYHWLATGYSAGFSILFYGLLG